MTENVVSQRIADFLAATSGRDSIPLELDLIESGIIDSLTMMDLLIFVESEFAARLSFSDLTPESFRTIGSIAAMIASRAGQGGTTQAA